MKNDFLSELQWNALLRGIEQDKCVVCVGPEFTTLYLSRNTSLTNVDALAKLLNLRRLYLWNTAIPKDKIAELQRALPNCDIDF